MGLKSSKQEKTTKTDKLSKNGNSGKTLDSEEKVNSETAMSFDVETEKSVKSEEVAIEKSGFSESVVSSECLEDSESREASGIDSEVSQDDTNDDIESLAESQLETASEYDFIDSQHSDSDSESELTADDEELNSKTSVSSTFSGDDSMLSYGVNSLKEELMTNHVDFNPDPLNLHVEEVVEVVENMTTSDDRERIPCGADVTGQEHHEQLGQYDSDDYFPENSVSSTDNSSDNISEGVSLELSSDPYPIQSESRQKGIILICSKGPRADTIQSFWKMILEKRIPTVHMTCDYVDEGVLKCAPYLPIHGESEIKCGIYTIKRLGTEAQLSLNLKRQQLLIYEKTRNGSEYKHHVTHFHEITSKNIDSNQAIRNSEVISKHVSHQPNPQLLVHGSW